jgi:hypothetical protein
MRSKEIQALFDSYQVIYEQEKKLDKQCVDYIKAKVGVTMGSFSFEKYPIKMRFGNKDYSIIQIFISDKNVYLQYYNEDNELKHFNFSDINDVYKPYFCGQFENAIKEMDNDKVTVESE